MLQIASEGFAVGHAIRLPAIHVVARQPSPRAFIQRWLIMARFERKVSRSLTQGMRYVVLACAAGFMVALAAASAWSSPVDAFTEVPSQKIPGSQIGSAPGSRRAAQRHAGIAARRGARRRRSPTRPAGTSLCRSSRPTSDVWRGHGSTGLANTVKNQDRRRVELRKGAGPRRKGDGAGPAVWSLRLTCFDRIKHSHPFKSVWLRKRRARPI